MSVFDFELSYRDRSGFSLTWELKTDAKWVGLFGPSGRGKTTALELLLGWKPGGATGRMYAPDLARGVGYAPQDLLLFPHWSVAQNLDAARRGTLPGGLNEAQLLESLGLDSGAGPGLMQRKAGQLSGGEGRRVALARAILAAPDEGLLVLDEPLISLDPARRVQVLGFLSALRQVRRGPVLIVSHDAADLGVLVDQVQRIEVEASGGSAMSPPAVPGVALWDEPIYENRWLADVLEVIGDTARCALVGSGEAPSDKLEVIAPSRHMRVGMRVLLGLRGDDVLLGLDDPGRVSARNKLAGTVAELVPAGAYVNLLVDLGAGSPKISTHLTTAAVGELKLIEDRPVRLFFKTRSVRLLACFPQGN